MASFRLAEAAAVSAIASGSQHSRQCRIGADPNVVVDRGAGEGCTLKFSNRPPRRISGNRGGPAGRVVRL
jgi:hypothetical protein